MKTLTKYVPLIAAGILFPALSGAQNWSLSRWDKVNSLEKVTAITVNDAFSIGENMNNEYFVLRTANGGQNWDSLSIGTLGNSYSLSDLCFTDKNNGFIGGGKNGSQVLFKTTDNGNTFTEVTPNVGTLSSHISSVDFLDAQNGYVSNGVTILKTQNGGSTWTEENSSLSFMTHDLSFQNATDGFASGALLFTSGDGEVMKTTDGGKNWTNVLSASDPNLFMSVMGKLDFMNSQVGFAVLENSGLLFRTKDGGASWDTINVFASLGEVIRDYDFMSADTGHILTQSSIIYRTNDGGKNWIFEYSAPQGGYGGSGGMSSTLNSLSFSDTIGFAVGTNGVIKKYEDITAVSGIQEHKGAHNVTLFPNPMLSSQDLNIGIPDAKVEYTLQITNNCGQIVFNKQLFQEAASSFHTVSGLSLAPGVYYLTLHSSEVRNTEKLVVSQ